MELQSFAEWLYDRLTGDATLMAAVPGGVHEGIAPQGTAEPFIVFSLVSNADVNAVGQARVLTRCDWDVKVIAEASSYAGLADIADDIDTLLHDVVDGSVVSCHRVSTIRYHEKSSGAEYRHVGGTYRVQVT